uniref:Uncharacterized protein n=1 Tax=Archaeoglobus fulgidus TaxID=2234 RepID=A0A7J3M2E3_ARCFL
MKEEIKKELETLKMMIKNWKESYKEIGGIDSLEDFRFEIDEIVYPYLRNLYITGHITFEELQEFMRFCDEELSQIEKFIKRKVKEKT